MNTFTSPIEKYVQRQGYILAKKIDTNVGIVLKPKKWWIPRFLYNSIVKNSIEIAQCTPMYDMAYEPDEI